jgi:hypothetical protein
LKSKDFLPDPNELITALVFGERRKTSIKVISSRTANRKLRPAGFLHHPSGIPDYRHEPDPVSIPLLMGARRLGAGLAGRWGARRGSLRAAGVFLDQHAITGGGTFRG